MSLRVANLIKSMKYGKVVQLCQKGLTNHTLDTAHEHTVFVHVLHQKQAELY